jgi:hypothetical protein
MAIHEFWSTVNIVESTSHRHRLTMCSVHKQCGHESGLDCVLLSNTLIEFFEHSHSIDLVSRDGKSAFCSGNHGIFDFEGEEMTDEKMDEIK